jgi:ribose/xylose/arabinose/galactoside ABC-type transport system permease subunit
MIMTNTMLNNTFPARRESRLAFLSRIGPVVGLIGVVIFFSIRAPRTFPTLGNAQIILMQTAVVATAALGMTIIVISGGIDLSVGSVVALTSVVVALALGAGWPPIAAAFAGILAGSAAGFITGLAITRLQLVPFIVTLGMLASLRGLTERIGHRSTVEAPATWLNDLTGLLAPGRQWMLVAPAVWILIVLAIITAIALRYTRIGRHIFAVGSNEQTARLCGIPVNRTKILVYCLGGAFAGVAGVLQFSRLGSGDTTTATGMELDVIAAVVIGGASLNGGQGSILGTLVGALIMAVIANASPKVGWENSDQKMITGAIIIAAAAIDGFQQRRASRGNR